MISPEDTIGRWKDTVKRGLKVGSGEEVLQVCQRMVQRETLIDLTATCILLFLRHDSEYLLIYETWELQKILDLAHCKG